MPRKGMGTAVVANVFHRVLKALEGDPTAPKIMSKEQV